jgi:hypothetical protein
VVIVTCPGCFGKYGGPYTHSSVRMGDGIVKFTCSVCQGRGRVQALEDGTFLPLTEQVDAMQESRNRFFKDNPDVFTKKRRK